MRNLKKIYVDVANYVQFKWYYHTLWLRPEYRRSVKEMKRMYEGKYNKVMLGSTVVTVPYAHEHLQTASDVKRIIQTANQIGIENATRGADSYQDAEYHYTGDNSGNDKDVMSHIKLQYQQNKERQLEDAASLEYMKQILEEHKADKKV